MNPILSHIFILLVGLAGGAVATLYWKVASDRRRAEEAEKEAEEDFHHVERQMPELIAEMRADLSAPETRLLREFLIIEGVEPEADDPTLAYSAAKHAGLDQKLETLVVRGYVVDITTGDVPRFRMTEEFVRLLLKKKDPLRYRMN